MPDPYHLQRFVLAQDTDRIYSRALAELRRGRKESHWMWFIFPQLAGLGRSPMATEYAISSLAEARAYLQHPVLGPRLLDCAGAVVAAQAGPPPGVTAAQIFGGVDARKLHSSATLFLRAAATEPVFRQVLDLYFDGVPDAATDGLLGWPSGD